MSDSLRCLRMRSFFGEIAPDSICSLCKHTVGEHSTGRPAPDPHSAHIARALSKVAGRVRAKVSEYNGGDVREALGEVAHALEEEAEELMR